MERTFLFFYFFIHTRLVIAKKNDAMDAFEKHKSKSLKNQLANLQNNS